MDNLHYKFDKNNFSHKAEASGINIRAEFISHAEALFLSFMELDGISPDEIKKSLSLEDNRDRVFNAGESTGLSGSFFFFTHDNKFIIKTIK